MRDTACPNSTLLPSLSSSFDSFLLCALPSLSAAPRRVHALLPQHLRRAAVGGHVQRFGILTYGIKLERLHAHTPLLSCSLLLPLLYVDLHLFRSPSNLPPF